MKNIKCFKLFVIVTVLSLVFGSMVGTGAFAAESDAAVAVDQINLCYNEMMHLAINLEVAETLTDGDALGILIWDDTVTDALTAENATHKSFDEKEDEGGTKYFTSHGIPAPDMAKDIRIAGCIKDADGNIKMGTVITYSIYEYLNDRLATEGISDLQRDLYKKTLAYGKAAGAVFAD